MTTVSKFFNNADVAGGDLYWPANIADSFDYLEMEVLQFSQRNILKRDQQRRLNQIQAVNQPQPTAGSNGSVAGSSTPSTNFKTTVTGTTAKGKILLPIPDNVSVTDGPQWSDQSVGALGRFGGQALAEIMAGNQEGTIDAVRAAAEAGKVGIVKNMLNKIGVDPNALGQNVAGKIANPYLQQVFQGVGLRQFDFNWKLVPRNEREQRSIQRIIRALRQNILPNFSDDFGENSALGDILSPNLSSATNSNGETKTSAFSGRPEVDRWLTVPNIFNLRWKYQGSEIDSLPKLKQCVCKNISVQYTPDGVWATRMMNGKPQPIAYNLTLSFGEMSIITGANVSEGF